MNIRKILDSKLKEVKPSEQAIQRIKNETEKIIGKLNRVLKQKRIKAEIFVGGSLAKGTIIKKEKYDIDIFVRFDKKDEKISQLLDEGLKKARLKAKRIHGSRDYFKLKSKNLFEIIPVLKIKKPNEAENVTDLSYFHVAYILNCIKKNKKLKDEIILAKAFSYAQRCYGAESYIRGFSGYALELLVSHYGNFINFIKAMAKAKEQIILDPSKCYKNKEEILLNLNEAKLQSPIVFIDPTFKERNVPAALSKETFLRFQSASRAFLKKPSSHFFEMRKVDEKKFNFILKARSNRQAGDIAGSKLLKFYNFLKANLEKYFIVRNSDFEHNEKQEAKYYFKLNKRNMIIVKGPPINKIENLTKFRVQHKNVFVKNGRAYAKESALSVKEFLAKFKSEKKDVIKAMSVIKLSVI